MNILSAILAALGIINKMVPLMEQLFGSAPGATKSAIVMQAVEAGVGVAAGSVAANNPEWEAVIKPVSQAAINVAAKLLKTPVPTPIPAVPTHIPTADDLTAK